MEWSEEQVKHYVALCIEKEFYSTPSSIVLKSYYLGCTWRFDKMRAFVADEIQLLKQRLKQNIN